MVRFDTTAGEKVYQTDSKRYEAAPAYLMTVFNQIDKIGTTISNNTLGHANPNFDVHTQFILALIIDKNKRAAIKHLRKQRIANEITHDMSDTEHNEKMFEINMDIIGEAITTFDDFLGIVVKQEILRVNSPHIKALEEKYLAERGLE